jgi:hypothetical protein
MLGKLSLVFIAEKRGMYKVSVRCGYAIKVNWGVLRESRNHD